MTGGGMDNSLLDLFREEVRANVQKLNDGLVALEQTTASSAVIEPLMRAAHSIKGAARVVKVDPAVKLAHAMEECLVLAQHGKLALHSNDIDLLLRSADWLAQLSGAVGAALPDWLAAHERELDALREKLEQIATRPPSESAEGSETAPEGGEPAPAASPAAQETAEPPAPTPPPPPSEPGEPSQRRVVRVTAENLNRLMGLAGESLVESRWLQPFSKSLLALKRRQAALEETLDRLDQSLRRDDAAETDREAAVEARRRLGECRQMLADCVSEFENRARNADHLNTRLYREVIASRMRPFRDGVQGFPRMVRDLARQLGKKVQFEVRGETTDVDRDILEK